MITEDYSDIELKVLEFETSSSELEILNRVLDNQKRERALILRKLESLKRDPDFDKIKEIIAKKHHNTHEHLLQIVRSSPEDYEPWGVENRDRDEGWAPDCSSGCKFYKILDGKLGGDWGVCTNPNSHRVGLLTFEHQGCLKFEEGEEYEDEDSNAPF